MFIALYTFENTRVLNKTDSLDVLCCFSFKSILHSLYASVCDAMQTEYFCVANSETASTDMRLSFFWLK